MVEAEPGHVEDNGGSGYGDEGGHRADDEEDGGGARVDPGPERGYTEE
jgi:hypothetical protein